MELSKTVEVYGHDFSLNVAVENGRNWNNSGPAYSHYCLIDLATDDIDVAKDKATTLKSLMGDKYKLTLKATPKVATTSAIVECKF